MSVGVIPTWFKCEQIVRNSSNREFILPPIFDIKLYFSVKDKLVSTFYSFGCEKTSICWPSTLISTGRLSDLSPSTSDSNSLSEEILIL